MLTLTPPTTQGKGAEPKALGGTGTMTWTAGIQEFEGHCSGKKEGLGTWTVNSPATSVVSLVFMVRAPGGKVTPGLRGRGEGESVLGRERTRSWQKPSHTDPG